MICSGILNYLTATLLVYTAKKAKIYEYYDLAKGYGKAVTIFVKIVFFLNNWGIVVGYTTLINILISKSLNIFAGD